MRPAYRFSLAIALISTISTRVFSTEINTETEKSAVRTSEIGIDVGWYYLPFTDKKVDGMIPRDIYPKQATLFGITAIVGSPLTKHLNFLFRWLESSSSTVERGSNRYETGPSVGMFGLLSRKNLGVPNLELRTAFGISFIDFGLIKATDKTTDTITYSQGEESSRLFFETGLGYRFTDNWRAGLNAQLLPNFSKNPYLGSIWAGTITISYTKEEHF